LAHIFIEDGVKEGIVLGLENNFSYTGDFVNGFLLEKNCLPEAVFMPSHATGENRQAGTFYRAPACLALIEKRLWR
jgi:hypothetical protein